MKALDEIRERVDEAERKRERSRRNRDPIFDAGMMLAIQASSMDVPPLLHAVEGALRVADLLDARVRQNLHNIESGIYDEQMMLSAMQINGLAGTTAETIRKEIAAALGEGTL